MTSLEMDREFRVFLDKVDSQAIPDFTPTERFMFLNEAQMRIVKQRYSKNNLYRKGFEEVQKRTDDLSNLVKTRFAEVSPVAYENNTYRIDLDTLFIDETHQTPADEIYMFYLRGRAEHTKTNCGSQYIGCTIIQQDDLEEIKYDPFNKPYLLDSISYFEDDDLFCLTDGTFTVTNFKLTFLKRPVDISTTQDCELKEHMHKEIVQLAVQIALENVSDLRQTSQGQELNTTE